MHIYLHTDQVKNHQKRQIMYKYSKDGISVLSVLDARRAKKSGLFPVKIQVIHNRRQKYYSTGQELSKEDWANLAEVGKSGKQEPQAHGGTLEHREQLLNHQGAGGGTRRTWRFRV